MEPYWNTRGGSTYSGENSWKTGGVYSWSVFHEPVSDFDGWALISSIPWHGVVPDVEYGIETESVMPTEY